MPLYEGVLLHDDQLRNEVFFSERDSSHSIDTDGSVPANSDSNGSHPYFQVFFRNTWGTALALQLLRSKLRVWAEAPENADLGYTADEQEQIFDEIVQRFDNTGVNEIVQKSPEDEEDEGVESSSKPEASGDEELQIDVGWETLYWTPSVAKASTFLSQQLVQAKQDYHRAVKAPFLCTMEDWLQVAGILVHKEWLPKKKAKGVRGA